MAILSAKVIGLNYNPKTRKYSVKFDLEVAEGKFAKHESGSVWEDSHDAALAGDRAVAYLNLHGAMPDTSRKW